MVLLLFFMKTPQIINFQTYGEAERGYLSTMSNHTEMPFQPKRIFWIYGLPQGTNERGLHAHQKAVILVVCLAGSIEITCESQDGQLTHFLLDSPSKGLVIPALHWHIIRTSSEQNIIVCFSSEEYDEASYIRNYEKFKAK